MERTSSHLCKYIAAIPILALVVIIAILALLDIKVVFEPPLLLPILNTVFISAISFAVSYISMRSYLASGSLGILMLGCGTLAFGSGSLFAGWLIGAPDGANISVTIFNIGALAGSIFHLMSAVLTSTKANPELASKPRKRKVILAYLGVLIFIILITTASLKGIIPPFFIQWVGPTYLRQVVLGTAVALFATSALLFIRLYSRLKEDFLYWYALGLILIATGLLAVFIPSNVGSPIGWAGRSAQYLGGIYFLIAILTTIRRARTRGIPLERAIANFFREPEANFRVLIETVNDAIVSFDNEGRILLWNPAAERIFGYSRDEAVGMSFIDLIIPDRYADSLRKEIETFTITGKSTLIGRTTEIEAKRKDGKEFPVEFSTSARKIADGWIYTSIIRDITERKQAEEALRKERDRAQMYLDIAGVMIVVINADKKVALVNKKCCEILGYEEREIVGKNWFDNFIPERIKAEVEATFEKLMAGMNGSVKLVENTVLTRSGEERMIAWHNTVIRDKAGNITGTLSSGEDITERKLAEKELARHAKELARSNAELEQFIYIASHDLQEPLRMISIFTQLLERRYKGRLDKDADEFLDYIVDGAKHMQQMIEDLLAYSRIGTRGKPLEPTDFEAVLNQAVANLKEDIEENEAVVTRDPLPTVMADASQIVELLQHLISNAIKFRKEEPPRILVSAQRKGGEWVFSVRDNGIGISPEFMRRLFKIFQREYVAKYPGTGVGLAICRRIVERHGGRIWAESELGKGSTFYFTIPERSEQP
ncbi:MAG: PAS domain S-box protein [Candidatus Methanoperedens sp.]|nr:PAS domain S-box protein [Candidatus Methanoperedens sp.]